MRNRVFAVFLILTIILNSFAFGHSGRTDSSGGHRDNKNKSGLGYYHYHHGMGPHLHSNGICPYTSNSVSSNFSVSYSSEVKEYQEKLNKLNFTCGIADGYHGDKTSNAIKTFQKSQGITVDGKLNETTMNKINAEYSKLQFLSQSKTNTSNNANYDKNIRIQRKLKELGYYKGVVDGQIGPLSKEAIKDFQKSHNLEVDGIVGPFTSKALGIN